MTAGGVVVGASQAPPRTIKGQGAPLRIICPTYWYPQHASDTQATYVHDINRHLVRRGHTVTVVTPGHRSLPRLDMFDGVKIVRFPLELPPDLTYGRVAQSRVSWLGKFARVVVMAHYMEAQHRAILNEAGEHGADVIHAHWAIPTGPAAVMIGAPGLAGRAEDLGRHGADLTLVVEHPGLERYSPEVFAATLAERVKTTGYLAAFFTASTT